MLAVYHDGHPGKSRGLVRRVALPAELVFGEGEVAGQLAPEVMIGAAAAERAPDPSCPLARRRAGFLEGHAGSSKSDCMTDTI